MLRDVEGWPAEEVCEALDISEGNQRVLLHRARSKVRACLERYLDRHGADMGHARPSTCQELAELVTAYLEGALPAGERAASTRTSECPDCVDYVAQIRHDDRRDRAGGARARAQPAVGELLRVFRDWNAARCRARAEQ